MDMVFVVGAINFALEIERIVGGGNLLQLFIGSYRGERLLVSSTMGVAVERETEVCAIWHEEVLLRGIGKKTVNIADGPMLINKSCYGLIASIVADMI